MAPFGEGHEYTCIPVALIEQIGRPPRNWKFLKMPCPEVPQRFLPCMVHFRLLRAVQDMFREWREVRTWVVMNLTC